MQARQRAVGHAKDGGDSTLTPITTALYTLRATTAGTLTTRRTVPGASPLITTHDGSTVTFLLAVSNKGDVSFTQMMSYMMFPLVLFPLPTFEAVYCIICGRRKVAIARYRIITSEDLSFFVLFLIFLFYFSLQQFFSQGFSVISQPTSIKFGIPIVFDKETYRDGVINLQFQVNGSRGWNRA